MNQTPQNPRGPCAFWRAVVLLVLIAPWAGARQSVLYGGGPLYTNAAGNRNMIRASGFTTLVIWTLHVEADGDLVLNNQKIVDNGVYVGRADWPAEVAAFKTGTTSVTRIELGLSGHESQTFLNIRDLVFSQGTGSGGMLYKNFKVLHDRIPAIDGLNYDEESHLYDTNVLYTMKEFSLMLADLGFHIELDVFCCSQAWTDVFNYVNGARPGTIDRIDLQCYAGGGGNDPSWWNGQFGGLRVTPGLWSYPATESGGYWSRNPSQVQSQMGTWNGQSSLAGGFMWYLDDMLLALDQYPVASYGAAINNALGIDPTRKIGAILYQHTDYWGWSVEVGTGPYGQVEIANAGGTINDTSSIVVRPGWKVTFFSEANFTGNTLVKTASDRSLVDDGWNDTVKSLIVSPVKEPPATIYQHTDHWGWSADLEVGSYTLAQLVAAGAANDDLSSIKVAPGYIVTLYEDDNFQGATLVKTADDATLVDDSWNDRASSLIVAIDPNRKPVSIFKDAAYWGSWSARFATGAYTLAQIQAAGGLNDDITSVKVLPGYAVTFYEHDNFQGATLVKTADDFCLFDDGWNDRASSMVVSTVNNIAYAQWAVRKGLGAGAGDTSGLDADADGRSNLAEFALDGNPVSPASDNKQRVLLQTSGASRFLTMTFPVRTGAVFAATSGGGRSATRDGVTYLVEGSDNLGSYVVPVAETTPAAAGGLPGLSSGWEYRSFRLTRDVATSPRGFLRLRIVPAGP